MGQENTWIVRFRNESKFYFLFFTSICVHFYAQNGKTGFEEVLNSSKPVFVDFWAEWCGPCRAVSPAVEELSKEYEGTVDFAKVNVDDNNELASKYNVFSIPTLAIFQNGKVLAQSAGAASKDKIKSYIDKNIGTEVTG